MKMHDKKLHSKSLSGHGKIKGARQVALVCLLTLGAAAAVQAGPLEQAKRMHDRLASIPPNEEMLCAMTQLITASDAAGAARLVMQTTTINAATYTGCDVNSNGSIDNDASKKAFYSVSLKDFFTPWSNVEKTTHAPLNDMTATLIGMVRDGVPFNTALTANIVYIGTGSTSAANFLQTNNHYEAMENAGADLSLDTVLDASSQDAVSMPGERAGVFTTRAAGEAYLSAGTNRRMVDHMLTAFTCYGLLASNQELKDTTRTTDRIRQDVTRSPGGDSSIYLNSCGGCHAGLDPLAGALAYYDWDDLGDADTDPEGKTGQVVYTDGSVQAKNLINATTFKAGYITTDNGWKNYWREGQNSEMNWGWNTAGGVPATTEVIASGSGLVSLGREILSTQAFTQCQVERVYKHVCLQDPVDSQVSAIQALANTFGTTGYDMRDIFAGVAPLCMGN